MVQYNGNHYICVFLEYINDNGESNQLKFYNYFNYGHFEDGQTTCHLKAAANSFTCLANLGKKSLAQPSEKFL
jgi:hypothetical protein